ncbi:MAG TPA: SOS response-associated peptidase [Streptosporangiaceae bacterium]|jgi:putative SOS response-associated peptidase YedK
MCGRFASARKRIELLEEFGVQSDRAEKDLRPDYNVAPTKPVYAVLTRHGKPAGQVDQQAKEQPAGPPPSEETAKAAGKPGNGDTGPAERQLRVVRWGLVPYWAKDPAIGSRMINARAETVSEKPAYRRAFSRRRCLLPADGFYEWQQIVEDGRKRKQPYFIHRADGGPLAFAGLYELWHDKSMPEDSDDAWLWTATIITTTATDEVGQIHDRMPMVIDPASWQDWLDPDNNDVPELRQLLVPAVAGRLTSYPVSTAVNNVRNNGPELLEAAPGPSGPSQPRSGPQGPPGEHPPDGASAGPAGTLF